ncbi:CopG family ribbon-helix-helix protein [Amphritea pacifica]|uniref:CopG family ribbon-helix-helix protein n=1 Tax=Amphritea pacifica TaxID=2811233 RepID=UPI0019629E04|nr:ribbon-helix-helix domain-containing protein [Amphritea pacifica]MBN1008287.1 CopG family transcriptional regulator [Amphritea pacifica]
MKTVRTTVSLPSDQQEKLQALAEANGLSVAWMVRQAVGEFLDRVAAEESFNPLSRSPGERKEGEK